MVEPKVMLLEFHTVSVLYSPKVQPSIVSPLEGGAGIKGRRKRSHMQSFNINGSDGSKILKKKGGGGGTRSWEIFKITSLWPSFTMSDRHTKWCFGRGHL